MAFKKKTQLPLTTNIELVAINKEKIVKKEMTYSEALNISKKNGWIYKIFQIGFSQFKITE